MSKKIKKKRKALLKLARDVDPHVRLRNEIKRRKEERKNERQDRFHHACEDTRGS